MGIIEDRRKLLMQEMQAGQGSSAIFPCPVCLEPPFNPFSTRTENTSLFKSIFQKYEEEHNVISERREHSVRLQFIRIKPAGDDKNPLENAEQFIISLPDLSPKAFEIIGSHTKLSLQITVEENQAEAVSTQLRAHFPEADVCTNKEDMIRNELPPHPVARAYRLKSSYFFPLNRLDDKIDPLRSLCGVLGDLKEGQMGAFQVLFAPVMHDWQENMRRASRNPYDPSQSPFVDLPHLPKHVDKKVAKSLFVMSIRIIASDETVINTMECFFKQFESGDNWIIPIDGVYPVESILKRNTFVHGAIINLTELSYFIHLPSPEILDSILAIDRAMKSYSVPLEYTRDGPILGFNENRGIKRYVRHSRHLPNSHGYESGKSGYGKSFEIMNIAKQRIEQGDGVGIIDPHSSLIKKGILPRIPKERIDDVVYFNAGDFDYPMAINPLAHSGTKLEREHIRVDLLNFFEDLFEAPLGVNVQHTLNFCIVSLLVRKNSTLFDVEKLLIDKSWRKRLLQEINDDRIHTFWELEFPALEKKGIVTSIANKLSPLILPDSTIAPMLRQGENKIDFLKIMDGRKIFLCNLSHGDIGKRNSQLLGKLLVSKLQIAAMMREGDGHSPDFYLFIDEFQHMTCPSMADILSGARKYGLHLWLSNQMIGDIPNYILRHVFNASTLIFFATDSPQDQMLIEKNLSRRFKAEDLGQLKKGETYVKMVNHVFNMTTERVPAPPSKGFVDEIIALSRAKYTADKLSTQSESDQNYHDKEIPFFKASFNPVTKTSVPILPPVINIQEKYFLECVFHQPTLSVTNIYKKMSLSAYMGDKIKSSLKDKKLVQEVATHLGSGSRIAKFLILTTEGFNSIGVNFGAESGKGGPLHKYWQAVIRTHAQGLGFSVSIEEAIPSSKETIDISLQRPGKRIAVEISITTKAIQEIINIAKCVKAGYDQIISLHLEECKMMELKGLVKNSFTDEEQSRIIIGLIYDFCSFCR